MTTATHGGHSAQVTMRLQVNGLSLPVTQIGPDFVLVKSPVTHPPTEASMLLQVDQSTREWRVRLPDGISEATNRVRIAPST